MIFKIGENLVLWGGFVAALCTPLLIASLLGAKTADALSIGAFLLGVGLTAWWYSFLDGGGTKRIESWFRQKSSAVTKGIGAGEAIDD
ncbi:MAG: hypothetical protein KF863_06755 [Rubrivivax sp.]|nr:hypothetical protein [Rubrivivax sp.]